LAAASVVLCGAVWALLGRISSSGWTEFVTATGEQRAFELVDGSIIHLNTRSRLALRFSAHLREVRLLQGEALFRVRHDSARPFLVYTADAMVQATGTQFDVYRRPDGTQVAVIEGRVNVTPEAHPALAEYDLPDARPQGVEPLSRTPKAAHSLGVSQEAHVDRDGQLSVKTVPDVAAVLAWRERRLVFNRETLQHIVDEFNRYSARQLRLEDADLGDRVFSGVFDADDPDSLAQVLARASDVSVRYDGNVIVLAQLKSPGR
jgi:transmembrane sensor